MKKTEFIAKAIIHSLNPPDGYLKIYQTDDGYAIKMDDEIYAILSKNALKHILVAYTAHLKANKAPDDTNWQ